MKFFAIIATAVTAKSIVKRATDSSNALGYEGVKSGCDAHPSGYDAHLNNNQCSDGLFEDSICSTGFVGGITNSTDGTVTNDLAYHQCTDLVEKTFFEKNFEKFSHSWKLFFNPFPFATMVPQPMRSSSQSAVGQYTLPLKKTSTSTSHQLKIHSFILKPQQ